MISTLLLKSKIDTSQKLLSRLRSIAGWACVKLVQIHMLLVVVARVDVAPLQRLKKQKSHKLEKRSR